jgi:hypothetical protein
MTPCSIVEFIGIPGAGKSTIASALHQHAAALSQAQLPQREEFRRRKLTGAEKLAIDVRFAPQLLRYRLRRVAHDVHVRGVGRSSVSFGWERSRYPALLLEYIRRHPAELFVLDEWLVHRTIDEALRLYPDDRTFGPRFGILPLRGITAFYVFIEIDPKTALQRIHTQHQPGRTFLKKHRNEASVSCVLQAWRCRVDDVREELSRRGAPIVSIDGSGQVSENAEHVSRWLATRHMLEDHERSTAKSRQDTGTV